MPGRKVTSSQAAVVLVAVNNRMVRARLLDWLADAFPGIPCVQGVTPEAVRRLLETAVPAAALVDIDSPATRGLEILRVLRAEAPGARLVALTAYPSAAYRQLAMGAGACLCLPMGMPDGQLHCAIGPLLHPSRVVEHPPESTKLS